MKCINCEKDFNPKHSTHRKHGFYEECCLCGRLTDKKRKLNRTLGLQGAGHDCNKGSCIEIFKDPSNVEKAMVKRSAKGGFNASLPLGGYSSGFEERKEAGDVSWKEGEVSKKYKK